jgi:hypothetical protein
MIRFRESKWGEHIARRGRTAVIVTEVCAADDVIDRWTVDMYDDASCVAWTRPQNGLYPTATVAMDAAAALLDDRTSIAMDRVMFATREDLWYWQGRSGFKPSSR